MPKIIKLSDVMRSVANDCSLLNVQQNFARDVLADIQSYPNESFTRRLRFMKTTISYALGLSPSCSVSQARFRVFELATRYGIKPVKGSIACELK